MSIIPDSALKALKQRASSPLLVPAPPTQPPGAPSRASRIELPVDVSLTTESERDLPALAAITRDLSATGMFLVTTATLPVGAEVDLGLELPGADALRLSKHRLRARVVRRTDTGYGLSFIDPPATLRQAIELLAAKKT